MKWHPCRDSNGLIDPGDYDAVVPGGRYQIRAVELCAGMASRRGGYDVRFVSDDGACEHIGTKEFFPPYKRGERYLADAKRAAQAHYEGAERDSA